MKTLVTMAQDLRTDIDGQRVTDEKLRELADGMEAYAASVPGAEKLAKGINPAFMTCSCGHQDTWWVTQTAGDVMLRVGIMCRRCGQEYYVNPALHDTNYVEEQWKQITRTGARCLNMEEVHRYLFVTDGKPDFGRRPLFLERYGQYAHASQADYEIDGLHNAPWMRMTELYDMVKAFSDLYNKAEYLMGWRVWDDRPTYDQIRTTAWEGENPDIL